MRLFLNWEQHVQYLGSPVAPREVSRQTSYIRYLSFCHSTITGSRFFNDVGDTSSTPHGRDMRTIAACIQLLYEIVGGGGNLELDPKCCNFLKP